MATGIHGSTDQSTIHEKFSATINTIQGLCQENIKSVKGLQKNICNGIIKLCKKYNNSIHLLQGHNKRVVARAFRSYKKSGQYVVDATTINNTNFAQKALDFNFVSTLKGKDLKAFTALLKNDEGIRNSFVTQNRDELLNPNNNKIFNKLPMEAQKAFIEQNKGDIEFLSTFSNVYKEELAMPELLTVFKDAIISNRDRIIADPTILAYADKASVLEVASTLQQTNGTVKEEDKPLMKALLTAYATVDANIIETQLKETDKNAPFTEGNMQQIIDCFNNPEAKIQGELQALKDVVRGFSIDFSCPSGKKISIPEQSGASQETVFNKIKEQVSSNELNDTDKNALADFLANCSIQGMFSIKMPGETSNQMRIDGDGRPKLKVQYSQGKVEITIQTQGKAQQESKFTDANFNEIGIAYPTTEAEIVFTYDKESLSSCKNKTSNIKVKKFHQRLGETFVGSEILALKGLQKIKNENKVNAALDITEFDSLMSNPQILQENIRFLDTNPAALSRIPEKTLQHYIQEARDNNNDALSAALQKAYDHKLLGS